MSHIMNGFSQTKTLYSSDSVHHKLNSKPSKEDQNSQKN